MASLRIASIHNEKEVSAEFIVKEATTMWKQYCDMKVDRTDDKSITTAMEKLRLKHPELCKSYPITLRFMCQLGLYHPKPFTQYLAKIQKEPYTTHEQFIESQADYIIMTYQHFLKSRKSTKGTGLDDLVRSQRNDALANLDEMRANIIKSLTDEHNEMKTNVDRLSAEFDEREARLKQAREFAVEQYIAKHGEAIVDIPIVVQTDELSIDGGVDVATLDMMMPRNAEVLNHYEIADF